MLPAIQVWEDRLGQRDASRESGSHVTLRWREKDSVALRATLAQDAVEVLTLSAEAIGGSTPNSQGAREQT
jgi:hypothetical protein